MEQRDVQIVEGMIANNSEFAGQSLAELKLRQRFNIFVLAIHRQGRNITDMGSDTKLIAGDTLLLEGPQEGMNRILTKQRIIPSASVRRTPTTAAAGLGHSGHGHLHLHRPARLL